MHPTTKTKKDAPADSASAVAAPGWRWAAGLFLAIFLLVSAGIAPVLLDSRQVLSFNDGNIERVLSPDCAMPKALLRVWDNQTFFGQGGQQYSLGTASLGEWGLGPDRYRRWMIPLLLALGGCAVFWMLRQFAVSRAAAAFAAMAAMLCGHSFSFSVLGLMIRPASLAFAALSAGFIARGRRRGGWLDYAAGGGCLGLALSESPDIGVFYALTDAALFAWLHLPDLREGGRRAARIAGKFALYVVISGLLAWQVIHVMFATQIHGVSQGRPDDPRAQYAWATQWSLPVEETWNLVSGTYFGASVQSPQAPYWGRIGRSEGWEASRQGTRNFALTGYAIGAVPAVLLMIFLAWLFRRRDDDDPGAPERRRLAWFVLGAMAVTLMLAWGRYFPLYRLFHALPYMQTIRNPEKWIGPFMLVASFGMGMALDLVLTGRTSFVHRKGRMHNGAATAAWTLAGIAGAVLIGTLVAKTSMMAKLAGQGYGDAAGTAWEQALWACLRVTAFSAAFGAVLTLWGSRLTASAAARAAVCIAAAALTVTDLLWVNHYYVNGHLYKHLLQPNPMNEYIAANKGSGRFKILPPEQPALGHLRMTRLLTSGAEVFDPISVSRLSNEYATFFEAFKESPVRLWELGSVRHFVTLPGAVEQLNQIDGGRGRFVERAAWALAQSDGALIPVEQAPQEQRFLRMVEFTGALPRFRFVERTTSVGDDAAGDKAALARLAAADFDPAAEAIVHGAKSQAGAPGAGASIDLMKDEPAFCELKTKCEAPALMVRSCRYDPLWLVSIDGKPAPLRRVNYLFQGVEVPAGEHRVQLEYRPPRRPLYVAVAGRVGLLVLLGFALRRRRDEPA